MKRYDAPPSEAIKNYYEWCKRSAGMTSRDVAALLGITTVSMCNLSFRLDQMTGQNLAAMAKRFGIEPGKFFETIIKLRNNPENDIYATQIPKGVYTKTKPTTTRS